MPQESLLLGVVLACWLSTCAFSVVAQDVGNRWPTPGAGVADQPLMLLGEASDDVTGRDLPGAQTAALSWPAGIARVVRGRMQLEGGYSYLRGSTGDEDWTQHAVPDMLLRFGLTDRCELRLGWPGYVSNYAGDTTGGGWVSGTLDPNVGVLYDLWEQSGWLPQSAVLAAVPISLEGNPFSLTSLQPLTELMYCWETGPRTAITGRSGFAIFEVVGDNYTQFQQSLGVDMVLTPWLGTFVSWDLLANHGSSDDTGQHMAGAGLSVLPTERFAVSWRSAVGLNSVAPNFLLDIRFAYRF